MKNKFTAIFWFASSSAIINVIAYFYMVSSGKIIGDFAGFVIYQPSVLFKSLLWHLLIIIIITALFLKMQSHSPNSPSATTSPRSKYIFMLYLIVFIGYVYLTNEFIAGSENKGHSVISALFALLSPDLLFFLYTGKYRQDPQYKYVAGLWLVSSFQRGWFGSIPGFIILELMYKLLYKKPLRKYLALGVVILGLYPFVDAAKLYVRTDKVTRTINDMNILNYMSTFDLGDYQSMIVEKTVGRLQTIGNGYMVQTNLEYLSLPGKKNFLYEGIPGVALVKLGIIEDEDIGISSDKTLPLLAVNAGSAWNVNPSLYGWFLIYSDKSFYAMLYLASLIFVFLSLIKLLGGSSHAINVYAYLSFTLLLPGWIPQFVNLILVMLIVFIYKTAANILMSLRLRKTTNDT